MADDPIRICETDLIGPEFSVEQVSLETANQGQSDIITIEGSFIERVTGRSTLRWYEDTNYINFLNLRLVVSFNQKQTEGLYYIKDVYNAYLKSSKPVLKTTERVGEEERAIPLTPDDLTQTLEGDLLSTFMPPLSHLLNESISPVSPYYTSEHMGIMTDDQGFYYPSAHQRGFAEYADLVYFDRPLVDLLPFDPKTDQNIINVSRRTGNQAQFMSDALEVFPIVLRLPDAPPFGVPSVVSDHLSIHAVVYLDYPRFLESLGAEENVPPDFYMLNGGMGLISCVTVLGNGYQFPDIVLREEPNRTETGIRLVPEPNLLTQATLITESGPNFTPDSSPIDSPDRRILQDLRFIEDLAPQTIVYDFYDTVFNSLRGSSLDYESFFGIHRDDSFSSLCLSRGLGDNARFLFHFDLVDYLAQNSHFPKLYRDRLTARDLIVDGQLRFTSVPLRRQLATKSKVLDLSMYRQQVDFLAQSVSNDLPTSNRNKVKGPSSTYPEFVINPPRRLAWGHDISLPGGPERTAGIQTYEGSDFFTDQTALGNQPLVGDKLIQANPAKYQYGAEVVALDAAPDYLKKCYEVAENSRNIILGIYNMIVNSAPRTNNYPALVRDGRGLYDYITGKTKVELNRIIYNPNLSAYNLNFIRYEGGVTVEKILQDQINIYVELLSKLNIQFQDDSPNFIESNNGVEISRRFITLDENGNPVPAYNLLRQRLLEAIDAPFLNPQVILELSKAVDILASSLETVVATYQSDFNSLDDTSSKPALQQSASWERKMILLRHKHYFDETFTYGIENKYGYSYLLGGQHDGENQGGIIEGKYGIARITEAYYRRRIVQEFEKYFIEGKTPSGQVVAAAMEPPYLAPSYAYFTPHTILHGSSPTDKDSLSLQTPPIVQPSYITNPEFAKYDLDEYALLGAEMINYKYKMKYLDRVFYRADHGIGQEVSVDEALYNSLLDSLGAEHECSIEAYGKGKKYLLEIEQLKPSLKKKKSPTTDIDPDSFTYSAQVAIEGGLLSSNPSAASLLNTQGLDNLSLIRSSQGPDSLRSKPAPQLPPIKLSFGILGELELDPNISGTSLPRYEKEYFNSMVNLRDAFGLNPRNVVDMLNGPLRNLPNQTKSMLVCATTADPVILAGDLGARRILLFDKDDPQGMSADQKISYYELGMPDNPVYSTTKDPMKVYAKMVAFWMNYKQLCIVEYLDDFKDLNRSAPNNFRDGFISKSKVGLPVWRRLDQSVASKGHNGLLCRLRPVGQKDIQETLTELAEKTANVELIQNKELFDLPVYNEYFILNPGGDAEVQQGASSAAPPRSPAPENPVLTSIIDPEMAAALIQPPANNLGGLIGGSAESSAGGPSVNTNVQRLSSGASRLSQGNAGNDDSSNY
jgi:hypothetical protein